MFIAGLGTATPPNRYTQSECWDALVASAYLPRLSSRSQAILRKVLRGNNGICSRYLSFDDLIEAFAMTPDVLDARFAKHAPAVAAPSTRPLSLRDHRVVRPARGDHVRLRRQRSAPARPELRTGRVRSGRARVAPGDLAGGPGAVPSSSRWRVPAPRLPVSYRANTAVA